MVMHIPTQIPRGCFMHRPGYGRKVRRHVMLEAALTNETQQLLEMRDARHAGAAEGIQGIVGELAFPDVAADLAFAIVGGKARKTHRPALDAADAGAVGVVLAHGAGDDLLIVHAYAGEKMLGQIAAMETDALVGIVAVIV